MTSESASKSTPDVTARGAAPQSPQAIQTLIDGGRGRAWWAHPSLWIGVGVLALAAVALSTWLGQRESAAAPLYVTEAARKGNLTLTVSANGTLQPTLTVNIGSELSGTVKKVLVDVNDRVRKGQVLVELDTAKLQDQVQRSRATLAAAQAKLAQVGATVKEAQASLARLEEVHRLSGGKVPAASELDAARATLERARADESSARASVDDARAAASTDEINLSKAAIRSPLDGVVLSRSVDPGNAVAASLQAVTLLTIAEDLRRMQLQVSVDEADVGAVQVGQKASFTVSSFPSRRYPATIRRVAYGSTKTDNVVTYTTWLDVDNADLSLRPGMTAAALIVATERRDVLLVPATALRFTPLQAGASAQAAASAPSGGGIVSKLMPRPPRADSGNRPRGPRSDSGAASPERSVWVLRDRTPVEVKLRTGVGDGRWTEVLAGDLQPGAAVITDQRSNGAGQ